MVKQWLYDDNFIEILSNNYVVNHMASLSKKLTMVDMGISNAAHTKYTQIIIQSPKFSTSFFRVPQLRRRTHVQNMVYKEYFQLFAIRFSLWKFWAKVNIRLLPFFIIKCQCEENPTILIKWIFTNSPFDLFYWVVGNLEIKRLQYFTVKVKKNGCTTLCWYKIESDDTDAWDHHDKSLEY